MLPVNAGSMCYSCANASSFSRKPVTDMARLSARQRSFAAGAELCTPINCQPVSVFNINGEPLSPGSVSHWCDKTVFCAQPVTTQVQGSQTQDATVTNWNTSLY